MRDADPTGEPGWCLKCIEPHFEASARPLVEKLRDLMMHGTDAVRAAIMLRINDGYHHCGGDAGCQCDNDE